MNRQRQYIAGALIACCCAFSVQGDTVYLNSGQEIQGRVVDQSDARVVIERNGMHITLDAARVARVEAGQTDTTPTGDLQTQMSKAERLWRLGHHEQAYNAYREAAQLPDLTPDETLQISDAVGALLAEAARPKMEPYLRLLETGGRHEVLRRFDSRVGVSGSAERYANILQQQVEAGVRVEIAKKLVAGNIFSGACEVLEPVAAMDVHPPHYASVLGGASYGRGAYEEAADCLYEAVAIDPADNAARASLIRACIEIDDIQTILEAWEGVTDDFSGSPYWDEEVQNCVGVALRTDARLCLNEGDRSEDVGETYNKGLNLSHKNVPLYQEALDFYLTLGDREKVAKMQRLLDAEQTQERRQRRAAAALQNRRSAERDRMAVLREQRMTVTLQQAAEDKNTTRRTTRRRSSSSGGSG